MPVSIRWKKDNIDFMINLSLTNNSILNWILTEIAVDNFNVEHMLKIKVTSNIDFKKCKRWLFSSKMSNEYDNFLIIKFSFEAWDEAMRKVLEKFK